MISLYNNIGGTRYGTSNAYANIDGSQKEIFSTTKKHWWRAYPVIEWELYKGTQSEAYNYGILRYNQNYINESYRNITGNNDNQYRLVSTNPMNTFNQSTGEYTGSYYHPYQTVYSQLDSYDSTYCHLMMYRTLNNLSLWCIQPIAHITSITYDSSYVYMYFDYIYYRRPKKISSSYVMFNSTTSTDTVPVQNIMFTNGENPEGYFYIQTYGMGPIIYKGYFTATIDGVDSVCYFEYDSYRF